MLIFFEGLVFSEKSSPLPIMLFQKGFFAFLATCLPAVRGFVRASWRVCGPIRQNTASGQNGTRVPAAGTRRGTGPVRPEVFAHDIRAAAVPRSAGEVMNPAL